MSDVTFTKVDPIRDEYWWKKKDESWCLVERSSLQNNRVSEYGILYTPSTISFYFCYHTTPATFYFASRCRKEMEIGKLVEIKDDQGVLVYRITREK